MEVVLKTWLPHLGCECDIRRWTASHQKGACFFCQIGRWEGGGVEGHPPHGGLMADPLRLNHKHLPAGSNICCPGIENPNQSQELPPPPSVCGFTSHG